MTLFSATIIAKDRGSSLLQHLRQIGLDLVQLRVKVDGCAGQDNDRAKNKGG
jgi:hypothetical protein